ncbi:phosphoglycerate dehydrogenase-like enzyme [Kribbella sp. VKM Ac-2527]|uniref:Phosphoglycerate dehydrogenase-like enzyme n=1 Tax=Kribbella caucasensis TaxID=2512215 RepID=A0A4R6KKA3_9ACTN|nr:hydroxyacid dehydrogenase [Kribbella sp. VKM Ac-2527]TDO51401.1 phosphoglycerate dehydrogenase-like enzyme [Kribbella sp. VKM Ac-2527]
MTRRRPNALVVMNRDAFRAHFDQSRLDRLGALVSLPEPIWLDELDSSSARSQLAAADLLFTSWGVPRLTGDRLAAAPNLRAVFHAAGSVRSFADDALWARDLVVTSAADANAVPVAEYTLAAIIFAGKKAPFLAADADTAYRGWSHLQGFGDLSNFQRTIGVVGFSRIGRRVVELLRTLDGPTVLVADPYADAGAVAEAGGKLVELADLLPRVDVLSLHAPALPSTYRLIGAAELAQLPDHATVVNTARGSLIDSVALAAECRSGRLFAILDVTDPEPLPPDSPLRSARNVMVTPHIAGSLGTEIHRLTDHTLDELSRWLTGEPLRTRITAEAFPLTA